ncbi:MAG: ribosomal protein S18-alanine N-acetyltransferase [Acidimicrobiales bacterium]|nr:ribosomal protein S18-alanine N-acetyltransferase [Acidimicrobiales bacterium]
MTALRIEPMRARHIDAVRAVDEAVYPNPWSVDTWRKELGGADRHHLVVIDDDRLVAHAGLLFVLDEAHVTTVAVLPDRQSEGIATALLLALLTEARRHGSAAATLEVRAADERPQQLYARFGFRPVGARKGYYSDPDDDGIVMWLTDLQSDETASRFAGLTAALAPAPEA